MGNATNRLTPQLICYCLGAIAKYPFAAVLSIIAPGWASVVVANGLVLIPVLACQHIANRWLTMSVCEENKNAERAA